MFTNHTCLVATLIATILIIPCCGDSMGGNVKHGEAPPAIEQAPQESSNEPLTMADVVGEHNPKMIGIYAGNRTKLPWYLRQERSGQRVQLLRAALDHFRALEGRYPRDWAELDSAEYYLVRPLDPITGAAIRYGVAPTADDDFIDLGIAPSENGWSVTGRHPQSPDGHWIDYTWDFAELPSVKLQGLAFLAENYPNATAMRGALLAEMFDYLLLDYSRRRNEMPSTSEELLDGLWAVEAEAAYNAELDVSQPGCFVFGTDETNGLAAAIWSDDSGREYRLGYMFNPWPRGGWTRPPTIEDRQAMHEHALLGVPADISEGYFPENILWKCSLLAK